MNTKTHRTVQSSEPDTIVFPSGLTATLRTLSVCPSSVLLTWPDARSHTLAVWEGFGGKFSLNSKQLSAQNRK